jgi:isoquinoline 1-oxidoreductase alpha subunit
MEQTAEQDITFTLNGSPTTVRATPDMPLLWALRNEAGLAGVKFGCGAGLCRACTVHYNGTPVPSCQLRIGDVGDAEITTIEGIQDDPVGQKLIDAWTEIDVMQCGYCQAGQVMSAHALLSGNPTPSDEDIDAGMAGNICRCATYPRIRQAIRIASGQEEA